MSQDDDESDPELPQISCDECGAVFTVIWNRNPLITNVEYCPFCGEHWGN